MHTTSEASVIGVVGLSGGVGASTVSAALAVRAAQAGRSVLLVDGHPFGGGLDLLLGDDLQGDLGWAQLAQARGELDIEAVLSRLHTAAGCAVLTWDRALPRPAESAPAPSLWCQLATAVDVTVVDLPGPGRGGARSWLRGCTEVVAVVGAGVTGMAAAMAGLDALGLSRWVPAPHLAGALVRCTHDVPPTVAVARALDMPVLGVLRDDQEVHRALNTGAPMGARSGPVQRVEQVAAAHTVRLGSQGSAQLREQLHTTLLGLGPLQELVADEQVSDVLVNGDRGVWVDRGRGLEATTVSLTDGRSLRRLAVRLAGLAGQRLDDAAPYVDGLLPGGVRLHAVLPPLVEGAAHVSLRIPRRVVPALGDLRDWGMFDDDLAQVLTALVQRQVSFVIGGGTGTGKTTLLAALLALVPARERIVVVEDTRELRIAHPHVVHLQGRGPNVEGRGEITLATLVRQSLRMRPDRLVLGEVRGAEVREMLTALNTGHEGGCGTVHANSAGDVLARFEALGALAGMDTAAVRAQVGSAIQVVVQLTRCEGMRRVHEVAVLQGRGAEAVVRPALTRGAAGMVTGPGHPELCRLLDGSA